MKTERIVPADEKLSRAKEPRDFSIRTILVPTDFSPPSLKALKYARALAAKFRATLHLINVWDVQFEAPSLAPLYATDDQIERRLGRQLRAIAEKFTPAIGKGRCHARIGRACDEICEAAQKLHADLIVTATRGYTGLKHILIGSTAERVVRHASCPVLVVRENEREFIDEDPAKKTPTRTAALRLHHILVPTDFSEHSRVALQYAIAFAKRFGAKLTLMNVIHPVYYAGNPDTVAIDYGMLLDSIRATARSDMNDFVRATAFQGVPFRTHIEEGHPGDLVMKYAKKCGADLIVNATHGRTGLGHVLLGSTAEHIVRYGKCPVLVVPRTAGLKPKQTHR